MNSKASEQTTEQFSGVPETFQKVAESNLEFGIYVKISHWCVWG